MVKKKLACFFTGGYTEAEGYMQLFLSKINDNYEYQQCIPNSTRKRKGSPKTIKNEYCGVTGVALLDKVYEYIGKSYIIDQFKNDIFYGILIEDDLDGRFEGLNITEIENRERDITAEIHKIVGKKCPVYFVYASPEIESWFIADWDNGFGKFIREKKYGFAKDTGYRNKYAINLKKNIETELFLDGEIKIEDYAYSLGEYHKLSDDLARVIEKTNVELSQDLGKNDLGFRYSKKNDGAKMLRYIEPTKIKEKCTKYFAKSYIDLKRNN